MRALVAENWLIVLCCVLGGAAVYCFLPKARGLGTTGAVLAGLAGGAALVIAGIVVAAAETIWVETLLFYAFSAIAIIGGGLMICQSNPVHAALSFAMVVLSTCGLFLLQAAPFLMAATIIVYAGAIIVTFLFVIMLAQQGGLSNADRRSREPFLATLAGFVLLAALLAVLQRTYDTSPIDGLLDQARRAAEAESARELQAALGDTEAFLNDFHQLIPENASLEKPASKQEELRVELATALSNAQPPLWKLRKAPERFGEADLEEARQQLAAIYQLGQQMRDDYGSLRPETPLSPLGNPKVLAIDEERPAERLPANNVTALGRVLFMQHLLAIELVGTLLLVASIGAIAIVARRAEGLR